MKNILLLLLSFNLIVVNSNAAGGPDAYGYTWLSDLDAGGPTFNWIDISTTGTLITGLADDNSHPAQISLGFNFHYYWSDYNKVKIGSNGWLSFDNPSNIASCFPSLPTAGDGVENIIAAFMTDLTFLGVGNPAQAYYWSNFTDSFIVQFNNVPYWMAAAPNYTPTNTSFQVILSAVDSSITFQYMNVAPFTDLFGCNDLSIGIENLSGSVGLQCYLDANPPINHVIKFYYPDIPLLSIPDATPFWLQQSSNKGFIVAPGNTSLLANIKNVGNGDITSPINVTANVLNSSFISVYSSFQTIPTLNAGSTSIVNFTPDATLTVPGQYAYQITNSSIDDINPTNDLKSSEIVVMDACNPSVLTYHTINIPDQSVSWNSGIGGDDGVGVYYKPPIYPLTITDLQFYISTAFGDGFIATIYADDGAGFTPGTVLSTTSVAGGLVMGGAWNTVVLPSSVTINSGGFYVAFYQMGPNIFLGLETNGPLSRQNYEILDGAWAEYRENATQDAAFRVNVVPPGLINTTSLSGTTISADQNGAIYQWLDCNNSFSVIVGESDQDYLATGNGSYAVQISYSGCIDTSACVDIFGFGVEDFVLTNTTLYPNPTTDMIYISSKSNLDFTKMELSILDCLGRKISTNYNINATTIYSNVSSLSNGVYTYQIKAENKLVSTGKFVKN